MTGNRAEIGRMLRRLAAQVKVKLRIASIGKFNEPAVNGITRCGKAVSASFENAIVTTAPRNSRPILSMAQKWFVAHRRKTDGNRRNDDAGVSSGR